MSKKLFAALCASAMALTACTACGGDTSSSTADSSSSEATTTEATTTEAQTAAVVTQATVADIDFEEAVEAGEGDAILAITDGQWYVQYWGTTDDLLTYDAGVAHIDGDGDYTVSVNVGTKGAQYDISEGTATEGYECQGCAFAAVKVFEGTTLYPDMAIEITEIRVDGTPVEMTAKNYTSSDDGKEMRANIYNEWVSTLPDDAHDANGAVSGDEYSPKIINLDDFATWSKIEVDFTVTGTGAEGSGSTGEEETDDTTDEAAEAETTAEATTEAAE